jgi:hypothetical protein
MAHVSAEFAKKYGFEEFWHGNIQVPCDGGHGYEAGERCNGEIVRLPRCEWLRDQSEQYAGLVAQWRTTLSAIDLQIACLKIERSTVHAQVERWKVDQQCIEGLE